MSTLLPTLVKWNSCLRTWKVQISLIMLLCSIFYGCCKIDCYQSVSSTLWNDAVASLPPDMMEGTSSSFVLVDEVSPLPPPRYEVCPNGVTLCPMDNVCCAHLCLSGGAIDDTTDENVTNTNATCCNSNTADRSSRFHYVDIENHFQTSTSSTPTGCGVNYVCSTTNSTMCTAVHPLEHDPPIPAQVPRTKLCHFTNAMTHIYALPMSSTMTNEENDSDENTLRCRRRDRQENGKSNVKRPVAAYLSTMGPLHEDGHDDNAASSFENISRVVILIHGSRRNVEDYLCCVNAALPTSTSSSSSYVDPNEVLILAPWFPTKEDGMINITATKSQKSNDSMSDQMDILRWIGNNNNDPFQTNRIFHSWRYGAGAVNDPNISSYDVVDRIVTRYLYNRIKFPALQHIIVTGHSAGGQYVQRWALLSNSIHDNDENYDDVKQDKFKFVNGNYRKRTNRRYSIDSAVAVPVTLTSTRLQYPVVHMVVANPKSYAYLDQRRWMNTTVHDLITNQSTFGMEFRIPTDPEISHCLTYNDWEWGLDHRSNGDELVAPYVSNAVATAGGINVILQRYANRHVIYLSGEDDVLYNGDCNDHVQGPNRRVRSERYFDALEHFYPSTASRRSPHCHQRWMVPNVPHNHCLMYQSIQGQQALFGILPKNE